MFVVQRFLVGAMLAMFYIGLAAWYPFYNLYLKDLGFSGTQIGLLAGVYQAMLFFVVPVWGIISDRRGNRNVLIITIVISTLFIFGFQFVNSYHLMFLYLFFMAFFHHPMGTLSDSLAIHHINLYQRGTFGGMRIWGSLGWALSSTVMGWYLLTHSSRHIFPIAASIYVLLLLVTLFIKPDRVQNLGQSRFTLSEVGKIFGERRIFIFLLLLLFYGISISPLYVFINLYFRDIGASNQLIGLAFSIQALAELPFFIWGHRVVKKFGAPFVITGALGVAIVRLLLYSQISSPGWALTVGLAQGLSFSLFWVSVVDFLHKLVPVNWRATAQSLIWAFHLGAGVTLGNICIGRLSDLMRMQTVMLIGSGFAFCVFLALLVYFRWYRVHTEKASFEVKDA